MYHMQVQYNAVKDKRRARTAHVRQTGVFRQAVRRNPVPTYKYGTVFSGVATAYAASNPLLPLLPLDSSSRSLPRIRRFIASVRKVHQ